MASDYDVPVLIAGGSLVGLSTALFLARHGVQSLVVERQGATAFQPRAAHFHLRTLELFRSAGIEEQVRRQSEAEFTPEGAIVAVDTLAGRQIASFIPSLNEGVADVSPCRRLFITQPGLEPILQQRSQALGARVMRATELVDFNQDADGVAAVVRSDGADPRSVRARYLIGADGGHSDVRAGLGLAMEGRGSFSNSITIYFHADVSRFLEGRNLSVIYVANPELRGFFRFAKDGRSGFLAVNNVGDISDPEASNVAVDVSEARCTALVRAAVGVADLPVTIDSVARWRATAQVAGHFQRGRTFLVGDAAHLMPPNGGFGGNTGVHDAHNLAWKLALVLQGAAGPGLLATYEAERRPVALFTVEQAYSRYVRRTAPWLGVEGTQEPAPDFDMELGQLYRSSAVLSDDAQGPEHEAPRQSRGRPGARAPHIWLERSDSLVSSLDLFGDGFVLLTDVEGQAWCDAAEAVAANMGVKLAGVLIGGSALRDPDGVFASAYGLSPTGASLVRPDGVVAWRSHALAADPHACLDDVMAAVLARR